MDNNNNNIISNTNTNNNNNKQFDFGRNDRFYDLTIPNYTHIDDSVYY